MVQSSKLMVYSTIFGKCHLPKERNKEKKSKNIIFQKLESFTNILAMLFFEKRSESIQLINIYSC